MTSSKITHSNWLQKFSHGLLREPKDQAELHDLLSQAAKNALINEDALNQITSILAFSHLTVSDVMLPRGQMITVDNDTMVSATLQTVIESGHSRFPILNQNHDEVVGILLAKDVLPLVYKGIADTTSIDAIARKATFVHESKHLDALLNEFRQNRAHMAIVIDEYGNLAGLVTIEDILEQIVGDIVDETDEEEKPNIQLLGDGTYHIDALMPVEEFNAFFKTAWSDDTQDTIAGLLCEKVGALPAKDDTIVIDGYTFTILERDERRLISCQINAPKKTQS